MKRPLLQKLIGKEELTKESSFAFTTILKYMNNLSIKRQLINKYTNLIFEGPLNHVSLINQFL